ncbi:MAG: BamA/TamA family outer membrane protein [Planctomycetota bacterium]
MIRWIGYSLTLIGLAHLPASAVAAPLQNSTQARYPYPTTRPPVFQRTTHQPPIFRTAQIPGSPIPGIPNGQRIPFSPQASEPTYGAPIPGVIYPGSTPAGSSDYFYQQPGTAPVPFQGSVPTPPPMGPDNILNLDVLVPPATGTGKLKLGGTYGTDNGFVGQLIIDERDFDILRFPRSFNELFSPTAWRGGGQHFRVEAVPGQDLERYLVSLSFPYFRNTDWSLGLSGYYYDRDFFDWDERRVGGRISLGQNLTDFLSFNAQLKLESIDIDNPRVGTSAQLNGSLGDHELYIASVGLVYDDRVQQFLTTEGTYFGITYSLGFGDFDFSKGELEFRNHRMIFQRPDLTGRHSIGYRTRLGFSGSNTPVFENFFGGGMTTLRGFEFRGVSPLENTVRVGGEFQWFNSLEYFFPLTQDDMIYGTLFVDFGTVEENIALNSDSFRVAPGFGFRVNLPFSGLGGAPFNIDFAFPVSTGTGDEEQTISFFIGALR